MDFSVFSNITIINTALYKTLRDEQKLWISTTRLYSVPWHLLLFLCVAGKIHTRVSEVKKSNRTQAFWMKRLLR